MTNVNVSISSANTLRSCDIRTYLEETTLVRESWIWGLVVLIKDSIVSFLLGLTPTCKGWGVTPVETKTIPGSWLSWSAGSCWDLNLASSFEITSRHFLCLLDQLFVVSILESVIGSEISVIIIVDGLESIISQDESGVAGHHSLVILEWSCHVRVVGDVSDISWLVIAWVLQGVH